MSMVINIPTGAPGVYLSSRGVNWSHSPAA
jgi:hypothetical protein